MSAVELHIGSKLFFEVYRDVIYLYLYPEACGNTVARCYTNLQHTFGHAVKWGDVDAGIVFQP